MPAALIGAFARATPRTLAAVVVALAVAVAFGYSSAAAPVGAIAGMALIAAVLIWIALRRRSSALIAVALPILAVGLFAPRPLVLVAEASLVLFVVVSLLEAAALRDRRGLVGLACIAVPAVWLLLSLNPNVPDAGTGLLGVRKASLAFVGLAVGVMWPQATRQRAPGLVVGTLLVGSVASLLLHFGLPSVENGFARSADSYTSLFRGGIRMQGLWAGPFHVALAGAFLVTYAWHLWLAAAGRWRRWAPAMGSVGLVMVLAANVRTAFLTLGMAFLLTVALRTDSAAGRKRTLAASTVLLVFVALVGVTGFTSNDALSSISELNSDGRALTRLGRWSEALDLFGSSPFWGNGAGSAGATLQTAFSSGVHVTTDNAYLVPLVEGGLLGAAAILLAFAAVARSGRILTTSAPSGAATLVIVGFAFTGNILEASPVAVLLMILIGLQVRTLTEGRSA
jgi:O-antigen ligase